MYKDTEQIPAGTEAIPGTIEEPNVYDLADWIEHPPAAAELVINDCLRKGDYMLIGGSSKSRKSWFMMEMAIAASQGAEFLNMKFRRSTVLYVDFELSNYNLYKRFSHILTAKGTKAKPGKLLINPFRGHYFEDPFDYLETIHEVVQQKQVDLVLWDPFSNMLTGQVSENDNAAILGILNGFRERLLKEEQCALIMSHHFSKGDQSTKDPLDRFSGAGAFARNADALITITKPLEGPKDTYDVHTTLRAFVSPDPYCIKWENFQFHTIEALPQQPGTKKRTGFMLDPDEIRLAMPYEDRPAPMTIVLQNLTRKFQNQASESTIRKQVEHHSIESTERVEGVSYYRIVNRSLGAMGAGPSSFISLHPITEEWIAEEIERRKAAKAKAQQKAKSAGQKPKEDTPAS